MKSIHLRFPSDDIHKAIKKVAERNHRSLNNEIIQAIEYYLKNAPEAQKEVLKQSPPTK